MKGRCERIMEHGAFCGLTQPCTMHAELEVIFHDPESCTAYLRNPDSNGLLSVGHYIRGGWTWHTLASEDHKRRAERLRRQGGAS